jgi:hypothetical protein
MQFIGQLGNREVAGDLWSCGGENSSIEDSEKNGQREI